MHETPDRIDYQSLVQDALRSVVRRCLAQVADYGLPGAHHFYIAFATGSKDVVISQGLRDKYPENITIVIQHDYKDLEVESEGFAVTLRFGGVPQRIYVPWPALVSFYDPSEQFALRLEPQESQREEAEPEPFPILDSEESPTNPRPPVRGLLAAADRLAAEKKKLEEEELARLSAQAAESDEDDSGASTAKKASKKGRSTKKSAAKPSAEKAAEEVEDGQSAATPSKATKPKALKPKATKSKATKPKATKPGEDEAPEDDGGGGGVVVSFEDFRRR